MTTAQAERKVWRIAERRELPASVRPNRGAAQNLRELASMRSVAVIAQAVTVLLVDRGLHVDLPIVPMALVIGVLALFNVYTVRRLERAAAVTDREVMFQISVDILVLTAMLGLSGGIGNPFVGMYLLPLTIVAVWLPGAYAWLCALGIVACCALIAFVHRPLPPAADVEMLPLMATGILVNYAIVAAMLAHFVVRVSTALREGQRYICEARIAELDNEHVHRIGILATGAAHELSAPLAAMCVVVDELKEGRLDRRETVAHVEALSEQLRSCRDTLNSLLSYGRTSIDGDAARAPLVPLDRFVDDAVRAFGARHPHATVRFAVDTGGAAPPLRCDPGLRQALLNLLTNAVEASHKPVDVRVSWDAESLRIVVRDFGTGIPKDIEDRIGTLFFTTKAARNGTGLGLYLAHTAITRLGGSLSVGNADSGGAIAEVLLPAARMQPLDIDFAGRQ